MSSRLYRLYIDESGDHTYSSEDKPEKRYLGLIGVIIEYEYYITSLRPQFENLKQRHFPPHDPDEQVIFHRKELVGKRGPFKQLRSLNREESFNNDFSGLLRSSDYALIIVVVDKVTHVQRYGKVELNPYHCCMAVMLERYCSYLDFCSGKGDVMAESRGKNEDLQLKKAHQKVCKLGTQFKTPEFFQRVLTTNEIKLKPKSKNIAGLQLADLLAHPCKNQVLLEQKRINKREEVFGSKICEHVQSKYYGKVFLA